MSYASVSTILVTEEIYSDHNHGCLHSPSSQHRPGTQGTVREYNGAFPLRGTTRFGTARYGTARLGSKTKQRNFLINLQYIFNMLKLASSLANLIGAAPQHPVLTSRHCAILNLMQMKNEAVRNTFTVFTMPCAV